MNIHNNKWLVPGAFANIYILWGLTFIAISVGLNGFPPFILSALRFLVAGILIYAYLRSKGERANSIINWKKNAIVGTLILTGGTGLLGWAEQYVSASEAAIATATGPFFFIAIDKKNWRRYCADKWIPLGLFIGFSGLVLFLGGSVSGGHNGMVSGTSQKIIAFVVLGLSSVSWVLGSLYSKNNPASHSTFMNIAEQLIAAGLSSFIIAFLRNEWSGFAITEVSLPAWYSLLFLILFGSVVTYISYIWLLSVRDAALVSTHTYINPIVTVLAGWWLAAETINARQVWGLLIILTGVLLTNFTRYFRLNNRSKVKLRRRLRVVYSTRRA